MLDERQSKYKIKKRKKSYKLDFFKLLNLIAESMNNYAGVHCTQHTSITTMTVVYRTSLKIELLSVGNQTSRNYALENISSISM